MSGGVLLLGAVEFQDFEIPSNVNFGGAQRLAIHYLSDGTKIIDTLGPDDRDITFSGVFSGPDATLRARMLNEMRASGSVYPLSWDVFLYSVLIKRFEADYRSGWWIPYRLSCAVLRDEANALVAAVATATESILADITAAGSYTTTAGPDVSTTLTAVSQQNATTLGTSAYSAASSALAQTDSSLDSSVASTEATLDGQVASMTGGPISAVSAMDTAISSAGQLASLVIARSYIGRAALNLKYVSS